MKYQELSQEAKQTARKNFEKNERKRIGLAPTDVRDFISKCDLNRLWEIEFNEDGSIK